MIAVFVKKNGPDPGPERMLAWVPDSEDLEAIKKFVQSKGLLPLNVGYGIYRMIPGEKEMQALSAALGNPPNRKCFVFRYEISEILRAIPDPDFAKAPVMGGNPARPPLGIRGQDRPMGAPDAFGFQDLGDRALGVEFDPMFGPAGDGTVSDIVGGLTGEEIPRR